MRITKKCPHCEAALEFENEIGQVILFTAHDEVFCAVGTRYRVRLLEQALLDQREAYERRMKHIERDIDKMLAKHGLPSLAEQNTSAVDRARVLRELANLDVRY